MSSLGFMVTEIRGELRRTGMDDAIKGAICAAVIYHRDKRFRWNELSFTFPTAANQQTYDESDTASIGLLASIDSLKVSDPEIALIPRDINWIKERVNQASGNPTGYSYYEESIWLDPTPSQVFTIEVLGVQELKDVNQAAGFQIIGRDNILTLDDSYTTAWFMEGYDVIKSWAKGYISLHHLRNAAESDAMFSAATALRSDQEDQLNKVGGSGFVRPTRF